LVNFDQGAPEPLHMAGRSRSPQRERGGGYGGGGNGDYGERRRDDDRYGDRRYASRGLFPLPILFASGRDRREYQFPRADWGATCAVVAAGLMTGAEAMVVSRVAASATARRVDLTTGTPGAADSAVGAEGVIRKVAVAVAADTAVGAEGVMGEVAVAVAAADSSSSGSIPMPQSPCSAPLHDFACESPQLGCRIFAIAPNSSDLNPKSCTRNWVGVSLR
jgi:hypothetical protein